MADIELVIKIPEELYEAYKGKPPMLGDAGMNMIAQSIANGTPLPKGHGKLKDVDKIIYFRCPNNVNDCPESYDFKCQSCDYGITSKFRVDMLPTIIEADNAESEDKE